MSATQTKTPATRSLPNHYQRSCKTGCPEARVRPSRVLSRPATPASTGSAGVPVRRATRENRIVAPGTVLFAREESGGKRAEGSDDVGSSTGCPEACPCSRVLSRPATPASAGSAGVPVRRATRENRIVAPGTVLFAREESGGKRAEGSDDNARTRASSRALPSSLI